MPQGIILVYDITNEKSFDNIKTWIRSIQEVRLIMIIIIMMMTLCVNSLYLAPTALSLSPFPLPPCTLLKSHRHDIVHVIRGMASMCIMGRYIIL